MLTRTTPKWCRCALGSAQTPPRRTAPQHSLVIQGSTDRVGATSHHGRPKPKIPGGSEDLLLRASAKEAGCVAGVSVFQGLVTLEADPSKTLGGIQMGNAKTHFGIRSTEQFHSEMLHSSMTLGTAMSLGPEPESEVIDWDTGSDHSLLQWSWARSELLNDQGQPEVYDMAPGSEAGSHSDISGYPAVTINGYPVKTRMKHVAGPGLLIDTGSPTNLLSRPMIEEIMAACLAAGLPRPMAKRRRTELSVGGIGHGFNKAQVDFDCPIGLDSMLHGPTLARFKGPDLRGTSLPGII